MRKLRVKLHNTIIYSPWGLIIEEEKIKHTPPSSERQNLFWWCHLKDIKEKNNRLKKSGALQVKIFQKVSRFAAFEGKWVGNHFYMAK